ncbi:MAG: SapC family protein [Pseudomonadota bacterium]
MYENLLLISPKTDANTRFSIASDWNFAAQLDTVTLTDFEVMAAAAEYPVVFSIAEPTQPVALLGGSGKNNYVNAAGKWTARHIPARLGAYPFDVVEHDGQVVMVRSGDAPHFQQADGQPLYNEAGEPLPLLRTINETVARVYIGTNAAKRLTAELEAAGLLMIAQVNVKLADGSVRGVNGFKACNEKALEALDAKTKEALEASGAMALLIAHRASLQNLARLFPEAPAAEAEAAAPKKAAKPRAAKPKAPKDAA